MVTVAPARGTPAVSRRSTQATKRALEPAVTHTVRGEPSSEVVATVEAGSICRVGLLHMSLVSLHASVVQTRPSTQLGVPPPHTPPVQVSPSAQKSVLHRVPLGRGLGAHRSVASLHTPLLQASAAAEQSRAAPPQAPAVHTSPTVQNRPSTQAPPSLVGVGRHMSDPSLHTPRLQALLAPEQSRAPPLHMPAVQMSPTVQNRPSVQEPPSLAGTGTQASVASLQKPELQALAT